MADSFGVLPIPLVAPASATESAGDPLLSVSLSFFQAVLNANAPAAWQAVFKDQTNAPVVRTIIDDDPSESTLDDTWLPTLYMYRETAEEPVWLAEDWFTQQSICRLIWVLPTAIVTKRQMRSSIINGIAKTLALIVERNRDPAWVVVGDPDPQAAAYGSRFSTYGGWMEFVVGAWKPWNVGVKSFDKGPALRNYDAVSIACRVVERLNYDLTRYDASGGTDITIKTPDGGVGDGGVITDHTTLP